MEIIIGTIVAFSIFGFVILYIFLFYPEFKSFVINFKKLQIELHRSEKKLQEIKRLNQRLTTLAKYLVRFNVSDRKVHNTLLISPPDEKEAQIAKESIRDLVEVLFEDDEKRELLEKI